MEEHGASVVTAEREATHVILPDSAAALAARAAADEDDTEYLRTVARREKQVKVHWWYFPDSYDSWVPSHDVEGEATQLEPHHGAWRVAARWLRDMHLFNEWMNEVDYEDAEYEDENPADADGQAPRTKKKTASRSAERHSKRARFDEPPSPTPTSRSAARSGAPDSPPPPTASHASSSTATTSRAASTTTTPAAGGRRGGVTVKSEPSEQLVSDSHPITRFATSLAEAGKSGAKTVDPVLVLPARCEWFRLEAIHEREQRALPEFFSGRSALKTPAIYVEYRNFMINTYQQNPDMYLSQTACRRNLAGDVCAVLRVHQFLEHWGLINFAVQLDASLAVPAPLPLVAPLLPPAERILGDDLASGALDTAVPSAVELMKVDEDGAAGSATAAAADKAAAARSLIASRSPVGQRRTAASARSAPTAGAGGERHTCSSCKTDCTALRYRAVVPRDGGAAEHPIDICVDCYADGRFPASLHSGNFTRIGRVPDDAQDDAVPWTQDETLLLVAALEQYGARWQLVARHVGTKSARQCIRQFLRLPCTEPYKGTQPVNTAATRTPHPMLSLVAFLSTAVEPRVAAAAADAAAKAIDPAAPSDEREVKAAAAAAIAAAAQRAKTLAQAEENNAHSLIVQAIERKLSLVVAKLRHFARLEVNVESERVQLAADRKAIALQLIELQQHRVDLQRSGANLSASTASLKQSGAVPRAGAATGAAALELAAVGGGAGVPPFQMKTSDK